MSKPDTMSLCEACGGVSCTDECQWCTNGFQNASQKVLWRKFRQRFRHISGTYGLLEEIVEDLLQRLRDDGSPEAIQLHDDGKVVLEAWKNADPTDGGRDVYSEMLKAFNRQALDLLT